LAKAFIKESDNLVWVKNTEIHFLSYGTPSDDSVTKRANEMCPGAEPTL
jgi:hypothetical protein